MALSATIYRFSCNLSDLDRQLYTDFSVHVALHPSETPGRMLRRLIAYCMWYSPELAFTKGLSTDNEPDLWARNDIDDIDWWLELGLPDAKRIKKASQQAKHVAICTYGRQAFDHWWKAHEALFVKYKNVEVWDFELDALMQLEEALARTMSLSVMIQDGVLNLSWDDRMLELTPRKLCSEGLLL